MRRNGTYLTCPTCGTSFYANKTDIEKRGKRFCSMACKRPGPDADRFWKYVPAVRSADACWEWTGARDKGYGKIWSNTYRYPIAASRMSWEVHFGPIPDGLHVCHRCDNPPCVNPGHLFVGTRTDNMRDMANKGRYPKTKSYTARGEAVRGSKLTEDKVRAIRIAWASGVTIMTLARRYGVRYNAVSRVVHRETWRHVG